MNSFNDFETSVDFLIDTVGKNISIAVPLGLGKPNRFINALYQRAKSDSSIRLIINTALSLERPDTGDGLERRFMQPFVDRVFDGYLDLDYAIDRRRNALPENVEVVEFFFAPGQTLGNARAQQNYVNSNYTHVARDMMARGVNAIAQLIAQREVDGAKRYSLSSNPDVTLELVREMREWQQKGNAVAVIGETNRHLPFMYRDAMVDEEYFDAVVDKPDTDFALFGTPRPAISDIDHMIGFYASTLVPDGGTLQIGIGSLGDAIANALIVREKHPDIYSQLAETTALTRRYARLIDAFGGCSPFEQGLYAATEMLVDGIYQLYRAGVVRRRVYDDLLLQTMLNNQRCRDDNTASVLNALLEDRLVPATLNAHAFDYLQSLGVIRDDIRFDGNELVCADGRRLPADLSNITDREQIDKHCLGDRLKGGTLVHGGFFLGPRDFYSALAEMPREESELICMTSVDSINQLYGNERLDTAQRLGARFINSCLKVSLLGNATSDTLSSGQVLSGVGGQYNFVSMAHAIPGGRSILMVRGTRESGGKVTSNIVWRYGRATIPRHLRDIVVSEYGVADLRSKTDAEVISELINIADSRFQDSLVAKAISAGKLPADYRVPEIYRHNTPERLAAMLSTAKREGHFAPFPFGTELTEDEQAVGRALKQIKSISDKPFGKLKLIWMAITSGPARAEHQSMLERMSLFAPTNLTEHFYRRLLISFLATRKNN